jgi:hypothetical protein
MKHLDKLREDKAWDYENGKHDPQRCSSLECCYESSLVENAYAAGWNDCQAEMMKAVSELRDALEACLGFGDLGTYKCGDVFISLNEQAEQALAKLRELEGGE